MGQSGNGLDCIPVPERVFTNRNALSLWEFDFSQKDIRFIFSTFNAAKLWVVGKERPLRYVDERYYFFPLI